MTQVFISYKSEERLFAEQLRDQLRAWGFLTWFDRDNIAEGAYFRHEIQKGLETSQVVVGVLTPEAIQSREVMWEWDYALDKSRFIPLKYRECPLPYHLSGTQYVDFTHDQMQGFAHLQQALTTPESITVRVPRVAPAVKPKPQAGDTNRTRLLQKVSDFWVRGVLEKALREGEWLELGLDAAPGAVLRHLDFGDYKLPTSARIIDVFKDMNRELLILGAPGAGKTILLLQLARDLIERARTDEQQPIPVVFNLSSWAAERKPLADWLADEFRLKYQTPPKVAKGWIEREHVLVLLDGLDEVISDYRNACVDAINQFREQYRSVDLAICSRIEEYETLTSRLDLKGAITLQPLTREQIADYLKQEEYTGLRAVMQTDAALSTLARTPFLLSRMAHAYEGMSANSVKMPAGEDGEKARRVHLFDADVERRLKTPTDDKQPPPRQVRHYLAWLSRKMMKHGQTVFFIEGLQPEWMSSLNRRQGFRLLYTILVGIFSGIAVGILIGALVGVEAALSIGAAIGISTWLALLAATQRGLRIRLVLALAVRMGVGILLGLILNLPLLTSLAVGFILTAPMATAPLKNPARAEIEIIERLRWMWPSALLGFVGGTIVCSLLFSLPTGLVLGAVIGAVSGFVGSAREVQKEASPNRGIRQSLQNAALVGVIDGVAVALAVQAAFGSIFEMTDKVIFALVVISLVGLAYGGLTAFQHVLLRFFLYRSGDAPLNYARFLDYAANIGILRKVGGGYIFAHRYLLEYFAELES